PQGSPIVPSCGDENEYRVAANIVHHGRRFFSFVFAKESAHNKPDATECLPREESLEAALDVALDVTVETGKSPWWISPHAGAWGASLATGAQQRCVRPSLPAEISHSAAQCRLAGSAGK